MQFSKLLPFIPFIGPAFGGLNAATATTTTITSATNAIPSLVLPNYANTNTSRSPNGEEVSIEWFAGDGPPHQICHPYDIGYRDDDCYPKTADCEHIYRNFIDSTSGFCMDQPSGTVDFGTLMTWNSCMIQVSLIDKSFACATAFDIAKQINIVLNSDYKSPDGKGVWTSYGNMKCPDGHYTNPINWMEWYMGCSA